MVTIPVKSRLTGVVVAGALAVSVGTAGIAFADETVSPMDVTGYVSASNSPASQAAPEILGLSGVDELQVDPYNTDVMTTLNTGAGLKYLLMGTQEYNINPNPYFFNTVVAKSGTGVVYNKDHRWASMKKQISNPIRALAPFQSGDDTDDAVWLLEPDVIIGNTIDKSGTLTDYLSSEYAPAVEKYLNQADGTYTPIASTYTLNSMADIVDKTYGIAADGEKVVANSNGKKQLRYGSATAIATNYEKYVKGTQAYILSQLETTKAAKKSVAVVESVNEDGTYVVTKTPSSFSTATRFLEITTLVAGNIADGYEGDGSATVTKDQLAKADLIVLTTGASKADMGDLATKTYWSTSNNNGAIYKVDANSVEIGTNYGRILGCLYPEYVDQSDWVAYYYDTFYHVKADKLADAVDKGMDGVRNWDVQSGNADAMLNWTTDTVKDYNKSDVQAKLDAGIEYIYELGEEAPELLQLSEQHTFVNIDDAAVSLSGTEFTYTGKAFTPAVTVTVDGKALTEGTDYTVSYADNIQPGVATVTVTGTGDYTGVATSTFSIQFADVSSDAYYSKATLFAAGLGLVRGYGDTGNFGPEDNLTRAQLAVILWRYADPEAEAAYDDVKASTKNNTGMSDVDAAEWYTGAANWAVENGVISGKDNHDGTRSFDPDGVVTFQEMVSMMVNLKATDAEINASDVSTLGKFNDVQTVADWAEHTMAYALKAGLYGGYDNGDGTYSVRANEQIIRGRVAAVIMNAFEGGFFE